MSRDFTGTVSRHALIVGMTNSDQVGMQQARAPAAAATIPDHAERLSDAGDGGGAEDRGAINEETGLNAEEQAEFERMASGGDEPPPPGDDIDGGDEEDGDGDGVEPAPAEPVPPAAAAGAQKTPEELATEAAQGKKPAPKVVSYGKHTRELKAAADRAAAAEAALQKEREDRIKLAERVAIINEALTAQKPAEEPDPNAPPANPFDEPDIDPTEDYAESVKQIQRRQRFQMEQHANVEQDLTESRADRELRDTFTRDFQTVAATPEYSYLPQAYQFLKDARLTQICLAEFDKDPNDPNEVFTKGEVQRMVQMFNNEEKWLVGQAIKNGKSPAHAILKQAKVYGFKPEAPAAPAARKPAAAAAPAAPQVPAARTPPAAPAAPSAADQLAELAAAREAGRSLSDGGGAPPTGLTAAMLVAMDDEEFAAMVDQLAPHQLNQLMGKGTG